MLLATQLEQAPGLAALYAVGKQRWSLAQMGGQLQELTVVSLAALRGKQGICSCQALTIAHDDISCLFVFLLHTLHTTLALFS